MSATLSALLNTVLPELGPVEIEASVARGSRFRSAFAVAFQSPRRSPEFRSERVDVVNQRWRFQFSHEQEFGAARGSPGFPKSGSHFPEQI